LTAVTYDIFTLVKVMIISMYLQVVDRWFSGLWALGSILAVP